MTDPVLFYRKPFSGILSQNIYSAIALLIIFSSARVYLVLKAQLLGSYKYVSLVFVAMIVFTLIALSRTGKFKIGLRRPASCKKILHVFFWGITAALIMGLAANYNFDLTDRNWFVYISKSYPVPGSLAMSDRWIYFGIFSFIGMTFSPIGEEFFYRGLIHESLVPALGQKGAVLVDAGAFSLVHLAHFGIYPMEDGWALYVYPAFLWVGFLMLTCLIFTIARNATKSIWGAVVAHAGFNVGMNAMIFFYILD